MTEIFIAVILTLSVTLDEIVVIAIELVIEVSGTSITISKYAFGIIYYLPVVVWIVIVEDEIPIIPIQIL